MVFNIPPYSMKTNCLYFLAFIFSTFNCKAQTGEIDSAIARRILKLIKEDSVKELSSMVAYPLMRVNPLPDISCADSFVSYYPIMFDSAYKQKLKNYDPSTIYGFQYHGEYSIEGYEIVYMDNGVIIGINYISDAEEKLIKKLNDEIKNSLYHGLKNYTSNFIVCETEKNLFRIDVTGETYRYAAWPIGHKMSEKPDIILYNGVYETAGTGHFWAITFKNGDWTYTIYQASNQLLVYYKDELKDDYPYRAIK